VSFFEPGKWGSVLIFSPIYRPIPMKRKIKEKATRLPMEVTKAVEGWETRRNLKVILKVSAAQSEPDPLEAIQFLVRKGCSARDIIELLDLLLVYGSDAIFTRAKLSRERWLDRANRLVLRLRRDANDAEELLDFIRTRLRAESPVQAGENTPQLPEESDSDADRPVPPEIPAPASPAQANSSVQPSIFDLNLDEGDLWDVMRTYADNLDSYIKMQQGYDYSLKRRTQTGMGFLAPQFKRGFGGTLGYLVLAAELVRKATGSPCYAQLAALLGRVCPQKALGFEALVKKINRFKKRNQEFMDEIDLAM
jgi:hypothetical protein